MMKIGVIGGGIAGAAAAVELAEAGLEVVVFEKDEEIGGQVKEFGCKATDICTRCNLCLVDTVFNRARNNAGIHLRTGHQLIDAYQDEGKYELYFETPEEEVTYSDFDKVLLATGYRRWSELETGTPEIFTDNRIIWAGEFEEMLFRREDSLQDKSLDLGLGFQPESALFIQCNGSRSPREKAQYCSRVCCGYNYRLARVLRDNFPEMKLGIFFIDMQESGFLTDLSFTKLEDENIDYYNCKPLRIEPGESGLVIAYEDQQEGKMREISTDILVLSEGIHPGRENQRWSSLFNLQLNEDGFLRPIWPGRETGVYLAGTITGPGDVATTLAESKKVAYEIIGAAKEALV
ncbi:MAG: FAD-dependent oxidoreductase [Bacillota bacterium]